MIRGSFVRLPIAFVEPLSELFARPHTRCRAWGSGFGPKVEGSAFGISWTFDLRGAIRSRV